MSAEYTDGLVRCSTCYIPESWLALPLVSKREYNHDSTIYAFGLPDGQSLCLPVCACILLKAPGKGRKDGGGPDDFDGSDAVRPYTPISDNSMLGKFELVVKRYDGGAVSQYLHTLDVGANVEFKHIKFNIKAQYPFEGKTSFTLLCGGTGISPMYQALWKLLGTHGDERKVTLVYSNKTPADILLREELDAYAAKFPERFKLVYVVGDSADAPAPAGWESTPEGKYVCDTGWIDEPKVCGQPGLTPCTRSSHYVCAFCSQYSPLSLSVCVSVVQVAKYAFPPSADTLLFVCGVPPFYGLMCGPRNEKELKEGSLLHKLGYTAEMVAKM